MTTVTASDVAVIVVNFNAGDYLLKCVEALHALKAIPGEIVLVDNASQDNSLELVKARYPALKIIELEHNTGFAAANNTGINATQKPWVALINPDAFVDEKWLDALLKAVHLNTQFHFFSTTLIKADDHSLLDGQGDCYHVSGLVWRRKYGQPVNGQASQLPLFAPCAAAALYSRDAVLEVGGFDEDYFCYNEDIDLGFRLLLAGYQCMHVDEAICYHVGSAITLRESDFSVYYGHRNLVWTFFKNMPGRYFWRYLPQHIVMNLVSIAYYTLKGRPGVILKAKWHALKGVPAAWAKRSTRPGTDFDIRAVMVTAWFKPYYNRHD